IHGGDDALGDAEILRFRVAVHERSKARRGERAVDDRGARANRGIARRGELVGARGEMPVRTLLPETLGLDAEKPRVEGGEPAKARVEVATMRLTDVLEDGEPASFRR